MNATSNLTFSSDNIIIIDYAIFFPQLVYAIIGGLGVIGNVLIIISIAYDAQLREQRILVMGKKNISLFLHFFFFKKVFNFFFQNSSLNKV